ncbi:MAG: hypothetical protein ORN51_04520, partial [Akkermansiaceae bacterium]|nr:hypothetical protein [Akkermansiaceae bacterium]
MKFPYPIVTAAFLSCAVVACKKSDSDVAQRIAELEKKNREASERQSELERQIEDQKLAAERDAIERERMQLETDREALERRANEAGSAENEAIRNRELTLTQRENQLEQQKTALEEKGDRLGQRDQQLSEREREVAGRQALSVKSAAPRGVVGDYGMFYDSLSSYGSWFETPDYGYVWQPVAVRDAMWRPYYRGRWVCSDRGWTWVSEEPFGWATYHYGRWALLRGRGWVWVPGTEWAPCWVSWRENDRYIGWAPLPPESMAYRGRSWDAAVDVQLGIGAGWYYFMEVRYFANPVYRYRLPATQSISFYQRTTNITFIHTENRQVICGGPGYQRLSDRIGKPLPFYRLELDQRARQSRDTLGMRSRVEGNRLVVNAPNIDAEWNDGLKPKRIKGRIDQVAVERDGSLKPEVGESFRRSRVEGREKANQSIAALGGSENFERGRNEKLKENRQRADALDQQTQGHEVGGNREATPAEEQSIGKGSAIEDPAVKKAQDQETKEAARPRPSRDLRGLSKPQQSAGESTGPNATEPQRSEIQQGQVPQEAARNDPQVQAQDPALAEQRRAAEKQAAEQQEAQARQSQAEQKLSEGQSREETKEAARNDSQAQVRDPALAEQRRNAEKQALEQQDTKARQSQAEQKRADDQALAEQRRAAEKQAAEQQEAQARQSQVEQKRPDDQARQEALESARNAQQEQARDQALAEQRRAAEKQAAEQQEAQVRQSQAEQA